MIDFNDEIEITKTESMLCFNSSVYYTMQTVHTLQAIKCADSSVSQEYDCIKNIDNSLVETSTKKFKFGSKINEFAN